MPQILDHHGRPFTRQGGGEVARWGDHDRRWEAAQTNRLNKAHWADAKGTDINTDLVGKVKTLRQRVAYETANNPLVRGMITTHKADLVGPHGPTLNVIAEDRNGRSQDDYGDALEDICREVFKSIDLNGELSLADLLRQDVEMYYQAGESLGQIVSAQDVRTPIKTRIHPIHPGRLGNDLFSPLPRRGRDIIMGIERDKMGRPIAYHIDQTPPGAFARIDNSRRILRRSVIHEFLRDEPGQMRGVPWLAAALDVIADLRDFDVETLDSARQANDYSVMMIPEHPDDEPITLGSSVEIERRRIVRVPGGMRIEQLTPQQPSTNYVEYRQERHRDLGRPVSMPAMITRLDSSKHNFSSARFDAQNYDRANEAIQAFMERRKINRIVELIESEAQLRGMLPQDRPAHVEFRWSWGAKTHRAVDPLKEAKGATERMANLTSTLSDELAAMGKDPDAHITQLEREARRLVEAGLRTSGSGESDGVIDRAVAQLFYKCWDEFQAANESEEAS